MRTVILSIVAVLASAGVGAQQIAVDRETVARIRAEGLDHSQVERPISFKLDVMPVFMAAGCNSGSCHGSARGQDGFRLSLFGFDPDGDYQRITREIPNRRINLGRPEESLLLLKAMGKVPHTGGARFTADSAYYATILRWLQAGAPADPPDVASPISLEVDPKQFVLESGGAQQQLTARAKYSDGSQRDVTSLAVFLTSNYTRGAISGLGLVNIWAALAELGDLFGGKSPDQQSSIDPQSEIRDSQ